MLDDARLTTSSIQEEAADLTSELISIRSYPGEEGDAQAVVARWLESYGIQPELQPTQGSMDRPNVIATVENGSGPTLLLNGHIDTVLAVDGWSHDPWHAQRQGDRLYGLGACDMKSGLAAAMLTTRALASLRKYWQGTVVFTSVVDEEGYSLGARTLLDAGLSADMCVVTESNFDAPSLGSCGKLQVRADITGKAAHAAWPWSGVNAAVEAARFVARLNEIPLPDHPVLTASQCILSIHSGNEQYVMTVPEHARVHINRQLVPGESAMTVLDQLQALWNDLSSDARIELTVAPPYYPPWLMDADHAFVQQFTRTYADEVGRKPDFGYRGFGDANLFAGQLGIPTIQFGPYGDRFHQGDEWVSVSSIAAAVRVLVRLVTEVLPPSP